MKTLARAKTTEEVAQWARNALPHASADLDGLTTQQARAVVSEVANFTQRYPQAAESLRSLMTSQSNVGRAYESSKATEAGDIARIYTRASGKMDLVFDNSAFSKAGLKSGQDHMRQGLLAGDKNRQVETAVTHEMGHVLEHYLENHASASVREGYQNLLASYRPHTVDDHRFNWESARQYRPSGYASADPHEMFAESFAALRYGSRAQQNSPAARELAQFLKSIE